MSTQICFPEDGGHCPRFWGLWTSLRHYDIVNEHVRFYFVQTHSPHCLKCCSCLWQIHSPPLLTMFRLLLIPLMLWLFCFGKSVLNFNPLRPNNDGPRTRTGSSLVQVKAFACRWLIISGTHTNNPKWILIKTYIFLLKNTYFKMTLVEWRQLYSAPHLSSAALSVSRGPFVHSC